AQGLAVPDDGAVIGLLDAVDQLHQRRLARPVLAEDRMDRPRSHVQIHGPVGLDLAVALRDAAERQERFGHAYFGSGVVTPLTCQSMAMISGSVIVAPAATASLPSALATGPAKGERLPSAIFASASLIFAMVSAGMSGLQSAMW